ncbi:superoxide dismutase [Leptolyngbya sp. Heron Island J]|uniref:superoxide dismutase n=1 Tax=Leptolyngbya sp. Heron Island J TaxID=1385935 RepID=UPI0003B97DB2|nr:superoxide dismutase [Leptolyngbya sp. Heron Island J]ESA35702.1 superoxide dismutase [Leptolyngbya sp. Heron Island J]
MKLKRLFLWLFPMALLTSLLWSNVQLFPVRAAVGDAAGQPLFSQTKLAERSAGEFTLPPLPYDYDALDDYIDSETMTIHHDRHHAGYVRNLNAAIANYPELQNDSLEELISKVHELPLDIRANVRKNGGGHANHTMFWEIMTPNGQGRPTGAIAAAIDDTFGDFEQFKQIFKSAGLSQFGSGWVWLTLTKNGQLRITRTANQDSPLMEGNYPILGNDVWEHAYYLKYQNRRGDYLDAWWNVVNWDEVNQRLERAQAYIAG